MALADIIDGKAFAAGLRETIAAETARLGGAHGIAPALAVVLVGTDPASQVYVRAKAKQAGQAGIKAIDRQLPENVGQSELLGVIGEFNADPAIHAILVQLPLPKHINADKVLRAVAPEKDVDGFHPINVGLLASGQMDEAFVPCTPQGCMMLLKHRLGDMSGAEAVVIGRSNIVGKPMAALLLGANCTVTTVHSRTKKIEEVCRGKDILIAAAGVPEMIRGSWIKPGAVVIDVGINRLAGEGGKSRLVGDVAFAEAREVAGAITPVPGGVGPMTIACLLANTVRAACKAGGVAAPDWSA